VRTILKGFVGAALLFSASAASAQDYTWTLTDFYFDKYGPLAGPYPDSEFGTTASGTLVLAKDGSDYILKSYNFFTTLGDAVIVAVYDSTLDDYTTDAFQSYINMGADDEETRFFLSWPLNSLIDEMDMNALGNEVQLGGQSSAEFNSTDIRYNGTGDPVCIGFGNQLECIDANAGVLTLTNIQQPQVATPEPGTLAILGAGLLGLFAARRRRAA